MKSKTIDKKWKRILSIMDTTPKELSDEFGLAEATLKTYSTPKGHKPPWFKMTVELLYRALKLDKK